MLCLCGGRRGADHGDGGITPHGRLASRPRGGSGRGGSGRATQEAPKSLRLNHSLDTSLNTSYQQNNLSHSYLEPLSAAAVQGIAANSGANRSASHVKFSHEELFSSPVSKRAAQHAHQSQSLPPPPQQQQAEHRHRGITAAAEEQEEDLASLMSQSILQDYDVPPQSYHTRFGDSSGTERADRAVAAAAAREEQGLHLNQSSIQDLSTASANYLHYSASTPPPQRYTGTSSASFTQYQQGSASTDFASTHSKKMRLDAVAAEMFGADSSGLDLLPTDGGYYEGYWKAKYSSKTGLR